MNKLLKIVMCTVLLLSKQACAVKLLPYSVKFPTTMPQEGLQNTVDQESPPILIRSSSYSSSDFEDVGLEESLQQPRFRLATETDYLCAECKTLSVKMDDLLQENRKMQAIARAREFELYEKQAFLRHQLIETRLQLERATRGMQSLNDELNDIRKHVQRCYPQKKFPSKNR